jgi:hypothetical protein
METDKKMIEYLCPYIGKGIDEMDYMEDSREFWEDFLPSKMEKREESLAFLSQFQWELISKELYNTDIEKRFNYFDVVLHLTREDNSGYILFLNYTELWHGNCEVGFRYLEPVEDMELENKEVALRELIEAMVDFHLEVKGRGVNEANPLTLWEKIKPEVENILKLAKQRINDDVKNKKEQKDDKS